ncbi:MAG: DUF1641 domain-containing protein [Archaeoglobales archaeon]|nr:DUF1641 domain-containing protein [Archaeoglobales archaeon]
MIANHEAKAADVLAKMMEKLAEDGDAILKAMDKLVYLEKSGVLDELLEASNLLLAIKKLPEEFLDKDTQEIAVKNIELLLSLAVSVDDETIKFVEKLVDAFKKSKDFKPTGITGALKALRDPDVQKALGFLLEFAKNLGNKL